MADYHFTPCPPAIPSVTVAPRFSEVDATDAPRFSDVETNTCFNSYGLFNNVAQTVSSTCSGSGPTLTVTVAAGEIQSSLSIADANYKALARANHQLTQLRVLNPCH